VHAVVLRPGLPKAWVYGTIIYFFVQYTVSGPTNHVPVGPPHTTGFNAQLNMHCSSMLAATGRGEHAKEEPFMTSERVLQDILQFVAEPQFF
jgi:hypothetical protein